MAVRIVMTLVVFGIAGVIAYWSFMTAVNRITDDERPVGPRMKRRLMRRMIRGIVVFEAGVAFVLTADGGWISAFTPWVFALAGAGYLIVDRRLTLLRGAR